jgi:uncharacterized damage-inducible protein DinB
MKEMLVAFATYNREANRKLVGILSTVDEATLREDQGSYYKSILGSLEHLAGGEIGWLRRFNGFFSYKSLSSSPLVTGPEALAARLAAGPASLYTALAEIDELFVAFVGELEEASLSSRVNYKNMKGDALQRDYWHTIFHILNHGTHHRGEISALLDRKGIANDYSGFNLYTK